MNQRPFTALLALALIPFIHAESLPVPVILSANWQLQDAAKVTAKGEDLSQATFKPAGWYPATVPGTALTTLVNNQVYPEPLYGENNRPNRIPDSLCRTPYWYRTTFTPPASYAGRKIWLNFDGINYTADVWVNGRNVGAIRGAFIRGIFDVSAVVKPGEVATLAVRVSPQPNPGTCNEHTLRNGILQNGHNGGISAMDGATFLCSMGWDWIPPIRDRNTGIWQKVFLSATGPVLIEEPFITTDLPLPKVDSADIRIQAKLRNVSDHAQQGIFKGSFGDIAFQLAVELAPNSSKLVTLDPATVPALKIKNPKLWWPNGYGEQNLYPVHLGFEAGGAVSDAKDLSIGVREFAYHVPGNENLTVSVNGVRVICKGGNWGMDEALKRIPRERLEAQVRMHKEANYTIIRNWVGQSTSQDLYELCDQYGIMLWDEFIQPNPGDGANVKDIGPYLANCRDKFVRFRNHASILLWCGRNEGVPPPEINDVLKKMITDEDPTRRYQSSSAEGGGVSTGGSGGYYWKSSPGAYYGADTAFKSELGSVSIPTLESVQSMMPKKDWESFNDDWVSHDLGRGAQRGDGYRDALSARYGKVLNLADFVRKAQLANYESFRAIYEGRFYQLFNPTTGIIIWMSNPAQPSFVWQIYSWDLESFASFFGVKKACEPVHIMFNQGGKGVAGHVQVINNTATPLIGATATVEVFNMDGTQANQTDLKVEAAATAATDLGSLPPSKNLTSVHFIKLQLRDAAGKLISENFYWNGKASLELQNLPVVKLEASVKRRDAGGRCLLDVTVRNPTDQIALMAHLQLRRESSGERVLPVFYSDNYISLVPKESKVITLEAASTDLKGDKPLVVFDGWNIDVTPIESSECDVALNKNAQVASSPETGLPTRWYDEPVPSIKISCGALGGKGREAKGFLADAGYDTGYPLGGKDTDRSIVDTSATPSAPPELFNLYRLGEFTYTFSMKPWAKGYKVRLYFAEKGFDPNPTEKGSMPDAKKGGKADPSIPVETQPVVKATASGAEAKGKRVFNVDINGRSALKDFDIAAAAGGRNKAVMKEIPNIMPDKDGNIIINLRKGPADLPKINGIEILQAGD